MADIDLGFPEQRESAWLTNRYFPSKVGGRPAWLDLSALPSREQLLCVKCQTPKAFLCQIYAPYDDEHNFHRTIFVFLCRSEGCQVPNVAENLSVWRSQLPVRNDFYSEDPPVEEGEPMPALPPKQKLCLVCGCVGPLSCGRCKKVSYCSALHQRAHWPQHRKVCSSDSDEQHSTVVEDENISKIIFPEWEIVIEPNCDSEPTTMNQTTDDEEKEKQRIAEFQKLKAEGKAGELQDVPDSEIEKYAETSDAVDDKYFRKFKKEVAKDPEQILRYKRNGNPLWIADEAKTFSDGQLNVPKCEACGGERQFEFQIMPQMLLLLKDDRLDWGVLAVYTCAISCKPTTGVGYIREFIVKQDILPEKQ